MIKFIAPLLAIFFLVFVVMLVKIRLLREEYSLLWLAMSFSFLILAFFPRLIDYFADWVDVYYAPALLFMIWLGFASLILLNYAIVISRLKDQTKNLIQENALLRLDLQKLNKEISSQDNH